MRQDELAPPPGSKKDRKRVGRGPGSGHGWFSGRGCKGQKSRSGNRKMRPGFEGGQLPIIKRLPRKRGFFSMFRTEYSLVKLSQLEGFDASAEITPETLFEAGLIKSLKTPVKVLADGTISKPLVIKANKFSAAAKTKIETAGGKVVEI